MTLAEPKIYSDAQALKILAERRRGLGTLAGTIQEKEVHEISGIKETTKTTITGTVHSTAEQPKTPAATPASDISFQASPSRTDTFGLSFQSQLRRMMTRDNLITGLQLLYLGDTTVLHPKYQVFLLRFDVSVNSYMEATDIWGDPQFARIAFQINAYEKSSQELDTLRADELAKEPTISDVTVYSLAPDYSSIVSQESLLSTQAELITANIAALKGGGTFSQQHALEESLLSLVEQPLQFAIYPDSGKSDHHAIRRLNRFGFAFGPRRLISKRSWINPLRVFGDTYSIRYKIDPGPRDLYALVVAPCDVNSLRVDFGYPNDLRNQEFSEVLTHLPPRPIKGHEETEDANVNGGRTLEDILANTQLPRRGSGILGIMETLRQVLTGTSNVSGSSKTIDVSPRKVHTACSTPEITKLTPWPSEVYPKLTNTLLLKAPASVSSDTEVFINQVAIPKDKIHVLGRNQLKVIVEPNDALKALLRNKDNKGDPKAEIRLVTPGIPSVTSDSHDSFTAELTMKDSDSKPDPSYKINPDKGSSGTDVTFIASSLDTDLSSETIEVTVAGKPATLIPGQQKKSSFIFSIPDVGKAEGAVSVAVTLSGKPLTYLPNAFILEKAKQ
jgi:hypothetical protein